MAMKVRLLDRDLIRTFGGAVIEMNSSQAKKYISLKKGIEYLEPAKGSRAIGKAMSVPQHNKMMWSPPEKKVFNPEIGNNTKINDDIFPGPEDKLFPQID